DGMQSQVLLAADRIAMINPANGNTKPMFVGQGDQIFMNEVFLKYLTAPTITSGGIVRRHGIYYVILYGLIGL
ncbi:hypothetical protein BY71_16080, partial [Escherichia coli O157:H7 str. K2324]